MTVCVATQGLRQSLRLVPLKAVMACTAPFAYSILFHPCHVRDYSIGATSGLVSGKAAYTNIVPADAERVKEGRPLKDERRSPGTTVPGLAIRWSVKDYLALPASGLGVLCPRWGFEGAFAAAVAGLGPGFGPVIVRASLPVLTTGALFAATGFFVTGLAGPRCGWAVAAGCCPRWRVLSVVPFVWTGLAGTTVGAPVTCGLGTPGA